MGPLSSLLTAMKSVLSHDTVFDGRLARTGTVLGNGIEEYAHAARNTSSADFIYIGIHAVTTSNTNTH